MLIYFPSATWMFRFAEFPIIPYGMIFTHYCVTGCPIRKPPTITLVKQLIDDIVAIHTSFFGIYCQSIHHQPYCIPQIKQFYTLMFSLHVLLPNCQRATDKRIFFQYLLDCGPDGSRTRNLLNANQAR